jgi:hypothetical protein
MTQIRIDAKLAVFSVPYEYSPQKIGVFQIHKIALNAIKKLSFTSIFDLLSDTMPHVKQYCPFCCETAVSFRPCKAANNYRIGRDRLMKFLTLIIFISSLLLHAPAILPADSSTGTGTVAETIDAGSYIYLRLEEEDTWIATTPVAVSMGDRIKYGNGMEMRDFYSKSLDRTFDSIFFVQSVVPLGEGAGNMHQSAGQNHSTQHPVVPKSNSVLVPEPGTIPQLDDGNTIAEIFAESAQMNGQTISVQARVMKVSPKIMGKNWITLQDGSGTEPDNKLMATSSELVSAGDLVIAKGILRKDIDIGSGYQYKVLLEEVTFAPGSNQ